MPKLVLTLGDSLTRGSDETPGSYRTYRGRLYQLLLAAGYDVDFIGTISAPPAIGGDPDTESSGGASIDSSIGGNWNLTARVNAWVGATPDLIILYAGWNDVYNNPSNIAARYSTFISLIQTKWPSAKLVMCTLHPQQGQTESQTNSSLQPQYPAINAQIRALANAGANRYVADLAALSSDTDLTTWTNQIVNDVKLQPDFWTGTGIINAAGGFVPNMYGGIQGASFAGMAAACALWSNNPPNPGQASGGPVTASPSLGPGHPYFINNVASVVPWAWVHAAQGHASTNTGVEQRNMFTAIRRSNGQWVYLFSGARTWGAVYGSNGLQRLQNDGITTFVKCAGSTSVETWPRDTTPSRGIVEFYGGPFNRDVIADATCVFVGCQMRLALDNPSGVNDMAQSRLIAKVGYDWFVPNAPARYDWLGFPYQAFDGGSGRYRQIVGTDWQWVTTNSADCNWNDNIGIPPPWGFWSGNWVYTDSPSYAITEAQLRANPPPLPPYREPTATIGSGYASGDYWDVIHPLQSGADKFAQVIFATISANNLLGSTTPPPSGTLLNRPTKGPWKPKAQSSRANWRVSSSNLFTPPLLTTGAYPTVVRSVVYAATSSASGTDPITWSASGLPTGLTMDPLNGDINGTTTVAAGDYTITITLTNAGAPTGVQFTRTLTVANASTGVTIVTPETIPTNAVRGQLFNYGLQATGAGPFTWSAVGNMPTGFEILSDGTLRGTGRTSGAFSFTAQVQNALGELATRTFTLLVSNAPGDQWVKIGGGVSAWVRLS